MVHGDLIAFTSMLELETLPKRQGISDDSDGCFGKDKFKVIIERRLEELGFPWVGG